ncbi:MAG: 50S ribosomal protein L6 [Candidatus Korarchaeum sp.]|nr:50S ribosomal protein L6 [Candidatus Korarchaeum sp.]MDW8035447.1 50S ribosomal protein L6 [Candidatus Korarchaeum sp.]
MGRYAKLVTSVMELSVSVPDDVKVSAYGSRIRVEGPKGVLEREFHRDMIELSVEEGKVRVRTFGTRKFNRAYLGTVAAHIRNMIRGVTEGFSKEMVIVYAHFPMKVEVDPQRKLVKISNFLGEKSPRYAEIVGDTEVRVEGDRIYIEGISKEDVGQTAANIRLATKIKKKDPRVFMDGIYVVR